MKKKRVKQREKRHRRIRKRIVGTADRPRLCVYRSPKNLSAQIIDDHAGKTLLSLSTLDKGIRPEIGYGGNIKAAEKLGRLIAERAKSKGIEAVVFDRGGYQYHGRVKALAEAARKASLVF